MFYMFDETNSGGSFIGNDNGYNIVIIEADSPSQANTIAKSTGIYFGGVSKGVDCPCCGDRWDDVISTDGYTVPTVYGDSDLQKIVDEDWPHKKLGVYYKDGTIKTYKSTKDEV